MSTEIEKCEHQANRLPLQDRALLIRRLIEGLDDLDEQQLEQLWIQEASRRVEGYKSGKIKARPSEDVFRDARTRLSEMR